MLSYPARVIPEEDGTVRLIFPDVPEATLIAVGEQDAFRRAPAILESALAAYVRERRALPSPSDIGGAPLVTTERFSWSEFG